MRYKITATPLVDSLVNDELEDALTRQDWLQEIKRAMTRKPTVLLSTVLAPKFIRATIVITPVEITPELLASIEVSFAGHPTDSVLRAMRPDLPIAVRGQFWDGNGVGLAVRPKTGVRNAAQTGDTTVALQDLEAVIMQWFPQE